MRMSCIYSQKVYITPGNVKEELLGETRIFLLNLTNTFMCLQETNLWFDCFHNNEDPLTQSAIGRFFVGQPRS